jgi:hypothetical protein
MRTVFKIFYYEPQQDFQELGMIARRELQSWNMPVTFATQLLWESDAALWASSENMQHFIVK